MAEARAGNFIWMEEFEKETFRVEAQILESPNGCYIRRQLRAKRSSGDLRQQSFKFFLSSETASTKCYNLASTSRKNNNIGGKSNAEDFSHAKCGENPL